MKSLAAGGPFQNPKVRHHASYDLAVWLLPPPPTPTQPSAPSRRPGRASVGQAIVHRTQNKASSTTCSGINTLQNRSAPNAQTVRVREVENLQREAAGLACTSPRKRPDAETRTSMSVGLLLELRCRRHG